MVCIPWHRPGLLSVQSWLYWTDDDPLSPMKKGMVSGITGIHDIHGTVVLHKHVHARNCNDSLVHAHNSAHADYVLALHI